jgi:hypothetical protein
MLLMAICGLFVTNCQKTNPATPTTGTISGKVTDIDNGSAIPGAIVITIPPTSSVTTNDKGNYTVSSVPPATYTVVSSKGKFPPCSTSVRVTAGNTTEADIAMNLIVNNPPEPPTCISPDKGAADQELSLKLHWNGNDPDGDTLFYNVYFDKNNPPTTLIASHKKDTVLVRDDLDTSTTYFWRVIATDPSGDSTIGEVWNFKTRPVLAPTDGLVAYYPFNGNAKDESGYGFNGVVDGAKLTSDRSGQADKAYYFDGHSGISAPIDTTLSLNKFTLTAWFKSDSAVASARIVVVTRPDQCNSYYGIFYDASNRLQTILLTDSTSTTGYTLTTSRSTIDAKAWRHSAMSYSTGVLKIYADGALDDSIAIKDSLETRFFSSAAVQIGFCPRGGRFIGKLDAIRIYNRALSDAEIKAVYSFRD